MNAKLARGAGEPVTAPERLRGNAPRVGTVLLFAAVTMVTQVGGVVCLAGWALAGRWFQRKQTRAVVLAGFYLVATWWIVPLAARPFGRVPLPVMTRSSVPVAPRSAWFWLANRHYVEPEVRRLVVDAAVRLREKHPGSVVHYLDAGFPFFDGFAMIPHLSHSTGKVVDLAFCYERGAGGGKIGNSPSPLGYGVYEGPREGEPQPYRGRFSWWRWDLPWVQGLRWGNRLDLDRTRDLVRFLVEDERTAKVLLEVHLHERLGVKHGKLRFQQLQAARHDDHLHVVVR